MRVGTIRPPHDHTPVRSHATHDHHTSMRVGYDHQATAWHWPMNGAEQTCQYDIIRARGRALGLSARSSQMTKAEHLAARIQHRECRVSRPRPGWRRGRSRSLSMCLKGPLPSVPLLPHLDSTNNKSHNKSRRQPHDYQS